MKMTFNVHITDTVIETIIDEGMEGLKCWCSALKFNNPRPARYAGWDSEISPDDEKFEDAIELSDFVTDNIKQSGMLWLCSKKDGKWYALTRRKIIKGIRKYLNKPAAGDFLVFVNHELWADLSYIDGDVADAVIQYALFGRIIYG